MADSKIIDEIHDHLIKGCGGGLYSEYYVGVTKTIEQRLFTDHNVPRKGHCYIFRKMDSDKSTREIEKHFLDKGMKGSSVGSDPDSCFVYVYKIKENLTIESPNNV